MSPASYRAAPPRVGSDPPYVSLLAKPNRLGLDSTWRRGPLKPVCRLGFPYGLKHVGTLRERGQRAAVAATRSATCPARASSSSTAASTTVVTRSSSPHPPATTTSAAHPTHRKDRRRALRPVWPRPAGCNRSTSSLRKRWRDQHPTAGQPPRLDRRSACEDSWRAGPENGTACADGVIEGSRFPPERSSSCHKSQAISSIDSQS